MALFLSGTSLIYAGPYFGLIVGRLAGTLQRGKCLSFVLLISGMVVAHYGIGIRWYLAHLPQANFLTTLGARQIYTQWGVHGRLSFLFVLSDPLHSPMVRYWYLVRLPQRSLAAGLKL